MSENLVHGLTVEEIQAIGAKSTEAKTHAYCPYSNFRVGCALLITQSSNSTGSILAGANVENAAYPVGICAERTALSAAVADGLRFGAFKAIAVSTDTDEPCSPCGMCRQFIREFCPPETPIFMFPKSGEYTVKTLEELLPMSFGPEALAHHQQGAKEITNS